MTGWNCGEKSEPCTSGGLLLPNRFKSVFWFHGPLCATCILVAVICRLLPWMTTLRPPELFPLIFSQSWKQEERMTWFSRCSSYFAEFAIGSVKHFVTTARGTRWISCWMMSQGWKYAHSPVWLVVCKISFLQNIGQPGKLGPSFGRICTLLDSWVLMWLVFPRCCHWKTSCTLLSQPPAFNGSSKAKLGIMNLLQVLLWFYFKGASSTFCPRACFFTSLASISANMMYTTKAVPSRQKGGSGKVAMSVDAIWDLLEHAGSTGVSAREALKVIGPGSRLSQAGGCHENSVDPWVRRRQIIYDQRATYSVSGANHYNLCADGSTHSGKDVLVSVIWCHQNNAAVLPAIQALLPCDAICPEELDLTSLVEELAKDLMT